MMRGMQIEKKKLLVLVCIFVKSSSRRTNQQGPVKMSECLPHDAFSGLVGVCLAERALKRSNEGQ